MSYFDKKIEANETIEVRKPEVIIPLESYRKIMAYAEACPLEISGFADIEFNRARYAFVVGDVYLLDQEVSGADTDIEEETLADFMLQMIQAGKTQLPRLWWHSHVNMAAFFSGIDTGTMKSSFKNDSFMVALVVNKRKEMSAMVEVFAPFPFTLEDIPVKIELGYPNGVPDEIQAEVEMRVKEKKSSYPIAPYKYQNNREPDAKAWQDEDEKGETEEDIIKRINAIEEDEASDNGKLYIPFPKKKRRAEKIIKQKKLNKAWDYQRREYVWRESIDAKMVYLDTMDHFDTTPMSFDIENYKK